MIAVLLRTTRARIIGSIGFVGLIVVAVGQGISDLFPTAADRQAYAALAEGSPTFSVFNGKAYDLTSLGGITVMRVGIVGMVVFPLVAATLAVILTRAQEDAGRVGLLTAYRMPRLAPPAGHQRHPGRCDHGKRSHRVGGAIGDRAPCATGR
jgi:ABC-2 type transport system permease protein|nr:hypothetical protein [Propionicimonas sp.]